MDRKRMKELVDQHMGNSSKTQPDKKDNQRTGRQTLKLLLADDEPETQEPEPPGQPKIILYLRDDANPAEKNFTKTPNEMYDLTADKLTSQETVLYMWAWRISWGFGKNYCRFSRKQVLNKTSINSESSVRRAISGLREKQFVIQVLDDKEKPDLNKSGSLYRICSPSEIASGIVEEGILLKDISIDGVYCTWLNMNRVNKSRSTMNQVHIEPVHYELPNQPNMNRLNMNLPAEKPDNETGSGESVQIEPGQDEPPLKDRQNLKDSLSYIVTGFYNSIGQSKISKGKRESAGKAIKELQADGFSLEDIQFASEWSVVNAKEDLYDFSIIKHTIGQAMAAKEEAEAKKAKRAEAERIASLEQEERDRQEQEREEIEAYKETLDPKARDALREKALREIKNTPGMKEAFINDMLIAVKENEILRTELGSSEG